MTSPPSSWGASRRTRRNDVVSQSNELERRPLGGRPRLLTRAEAAALLGVGERVLCRWKPIRHGPRPVLCVSGWAYDAETIERLAPMPKAQRWPANARAKN